MNTMLIRRVNALWFDVYEKLWRSERHSKHYGAHYGARSAIVLALCLALLMVPGTCLAPLGATLAYAADSGVEFEAVDDMTVSGTAGTKNDADLEVMGVSSFAGDIFVEAGVLATPYGGFGRYENLLTYSDAFDNAAWVKTNVTAPTADQIAAPDGATTAEALAPTIAAVTNVKITSGTTAAASTAYTFSVWAKTATGTKDIVLTVGDGATNSTATASLTTSWQRFSVTYTSSATPTGSVFGQIGDATWTADTIHAWGGQLEQASTPGVYAKAGSSIIAASRGIVGNQKLDVAGNIALTGTVDGYDISAKGPNWDTAYTDRMKWDGGATGLNAATGRTSLGLGSLATKSTITNSELTAGSFTNITEVGTLTSLSVAEATAGSTIVGNDTGGGDLLQLQVNGADKFVVNSEGLISTGAGGGWVESFTATQGQTVFTLTAGTYTPGDNELLVLRNGILQQVGSSAGYAETNSTTITFNHRMLVGENVFVQRKGTIAAGSSGDITGVTAGTGLTGGGTSGTVTLNVDTGTTANKIVQLDGTAKLPAVDGSQLTGITSGQWTDAGTYINANNASTVAVTDTGRLGIGTTAPGAKLHVSGGAIRLDSGQWFQSAGNNLMAADATHTYLRSVNAAGAITFSDQAGGELARIQSNGNVGIGTTGPGAKLEIVNSGTGEKESLRLRNANTASGDSTYLKLMMQSNTGYGAEIGVINTAGAPNYLNPELVFRVTGSESTTLQERMRIDKNGNVGIGTTGPGAKLHVSNGEIKLDTASTGTTDNWVGADAYNNFFIDAAQGSIFNTSANMRFNIDANNTEADTRAFTWAKNAATTGSTALMTLTEAGNVGIGTTAPGDKLHVDGGGIKNTNSVSCPTAGTWYNMDSSSDYTDALYLVTAWRTGDGANVVSYVVHWSADYYQNDVNVISGLAHSSFTLSFQGSGTGGAGPRYIQVRPNTYGCGDLKFSKIYPR